MQMHLEPLFVVSGGGGSCCCHRFGCGGCWWSWGHIGGSDVATNVVLGRVVVTTVDGGGGRKGGGSGNGRVPICRHSLIKNNR